MQNTKTEPYPLWHPNCQMKHLGEPPKAVFGDGIYLELDDGRRVMDAISSWWVTLHGHCEPSIADAIARQAHEMDHAIYAAFANKPALELSRKLMQILPKGLMRFLYSDCGSTSVEIALKLSLQYWKLKGHNQRRSFICFEGGYHGDTFGAMSVAGRNVFNEGYSELLFKSYAVPYPERHLGEEAEQVVLGQIKSELEKNPESYAGLIIEPLVQGAAGMRMTSMRFMSSLAELCKEHNVLLIFDEVFTGFGRTGDYFASNKIGVTPDIICLSKGISGGFLPLAATAVTDGIYDAFYSDDEMHGFYHSHSSMGNAIACAAANASIDLLMERESVFRSMEALHWVHLDRIAEHPLVASCRTCGTIAAFDLQSNDSKAYIGATAKKLAALLLDKGVYLRPLGLVIYLVPPYCTTAEQLADIYAAIEECLALLSD